MVQLLEIQLAETWSPTKLRSPGVSNSQAVHPEPPVTVQLQLGFSSPALVSTKVFVQGFLLWQVVVPCVLLSFSPVFGAAVCLVTSLLKWI